MVLIETPYLFVAWQGDIPKLPVVIAKQRDGNPVSVVLAGLEVAFPKWIWRNK
jgi:hypothetical protein